MGEVVDRTTSSFTLLILIFALIMVLINIVLSIPMISASVRRLHDTGKSGLYLLLLLIPFGSIVLFIFFLEDSHQAPNMYGPSPKYMANQNGTLMSNQMIQLADMSKKSNMPNMPNTNPQPQFIQAYPQQNIYENMYQQNPLYVQYPPQYPQNIQQIPFEQNLVQKPAPLVEQVDPNSQAGIIMPVVYP